MGILVWWRRSGSVTHLEEGYIYKVDKIGSAWSTQFFQEGIRLEQGKTYKVTFDAKAEIALNHKQMENPENICWCYFWYYYWMETYELHLNGLNLETINAKLYFFIWKLWWRWPVTTVYLDNITLTEITEK